MKNIIMLLAFILTAIFIVSFMSIDACMDAGGMWSDYGYSCIGVNESFVPQYKRMAIPFWSLVFLLSCVPATLINKLFKNKKP